MPEQDLPPEIIRQILEAIGRIERRFAGISRPEVFIGSEAGADKLDAICMMLIAIGESCKRLDKLTREICLRVIPRPTGRESWEFAM